MQRRGTCQLALLGISPYLCSHLLRQRALAAKGPPRLTAQDPGASLATREQGRASACPGWNASVDCRYNWSGLNIDQNTLGFSVVHVHPVDELQPRFQQHVDGLSASLPAQVVGGHQGQELCSDSGGYAFVV